MDTQAQTVAATKGGNGSMYWTYSECCADGNWKEERGHPEKTHVEPINVTEIFKKKQFTDLH